MKEREKGIDMEKRRRKHIEEKETEPYRRGLRFGYITLQNRINEDREDIASANSSKFVSIINDVEKLHEQVVKPREQVSDAEVLLGLTNTLFNAAKSHGLGSITPSDFVTSLIKQFGVGNVGESENITNTLRWKDIGIAATPIFKKARGCLTMIGPMENLFLKQRKVYGRRRQEAKLCIIPKEVSSAVEEVDLNTEKNIAVMFGILRKHKTLKLEHLILNRHSFAQTIENLFALSFLVKDGRVAVKVDDVTGSQIVSARNAPSRNRIVSEEVKYRHFVFRLDFPDWKLMIDHVPEGQELMSHRSDSETSHEEKLKPKEADQGFLGSGGQMMTDHPSGFTGEEEFETKMVLQIASESDTQHKA
ncbi:OLC1v1005854C1 [Oldenlandia corymbosa var. corymbosa]|uniref:Non-structural maintenance of chromosomes element 4 n=1 Tax=Oldenlandia corymbosa var. corymbosa TaxID=529605 RepID=A0AAV1DGW1_OLDCO|nr:OLC1v1005854C1 [Oldenlandia corymbosa var. corymbosa]